MWQALDESGEEQAAEVVGHGRGGNRCRAYTPSELVLTFDRRDEPITFEVPGNQPGTLARPWRLDKDAARRRRVAQKNRSRQDED